MTFEKTALAGKCISAWFGEPPALCLEYALRDTLAISASSSKFWAEYIEWAHVPSAAVPGIFTGIQPSQKQRHEYVAKWKMKWHNRHSVLIENNPIF